MVVDSVSVSSDSPEDMFPDGEIYMCQCEKFDGTFSPFSSHCFNSGREAVERCQSVSESVETAKIEAED